MVPWANVWWLFPSLNYIYGMNQFHYYSDGHLRWRKIIKSMLVPLLLLLSDVIFYLLDQSLFWCLGSNMRCMVAESWWKCINELVVNEVFIIILWRVPFVLNFIMILRSYGCCGACLGPSTLGTAWSILLLGSETLSLLRSSLVLFFPGFFSLKYVYWEWLNKHPSGALCYYYFFVLGVFPDWLFCSGTGYHMPSVLWPQSA
jgi:hypothetical protein